MCTAVVGGSIHRAATRSSAASDQKSNAPMISHWTKDRSKPFRSGVLGCVHGPGVTFLNSLYQSNGMRSSLLNCLERDGIVVGCERHGPVRHRRNVAVHVPGLGNAGKSLR